MENIENNDDYIEERYSCKWIDEFNCINIEDIRQAKISHNGDGNFVVLFFSKTNSEPIEVYNKHFNTIEDVRYYVYLILNTYEFDAFDFNYFKEHPEEFD